MGESQFNSNLQHFCLQNGTVKGTWQSEKSSKLEVILKHEVAHRPFQKLEVVVHSVILEAEIPKEFLKLMHRNKNSFGQMTSG